MRERRIVVYGHFGVGNVGNDSTLEAFLRAVERWAPGARVTCVCPGVEAVAARFGVAAVPVDVGEVDRGRPRRGGAAARVRRLVRRVVDEGAFWTRRAGCLAGVDLFVVAGTGALDDMAVRPWNAPYDLFKWCRAARRAGGRVAFLSVGAGPIVHPWSRHLMLAALRAATYRSYRDRPSLDYVRSVGHGTPGDRVYPDLTFGLPAVDWRTVPAPHEPPRRVGVGVIGYYGWAHDQQRGEAVYRGYVEKLAAFAAWLVSQGYDVRVFGGDVPTDERPVRDVVARVGAARGGAGKLHATPVSNVEDLCRELAQVDVLVATRFHNLVTGLMLGRPVLSIGYHAKNDALMAAMGLGNYRQAIEQLDVDRLREQFTRLVAEVGPVARRVRDTVDTYRARLDEQYRDVLAAGGAAVVEPRGLGALGTA